MTDLTVDERQSLERTVDWLVPEADDAVRLYMADKRADAAIVAALRAAWDVRITLVRAVEERKKLTDEQSELSRATDETRRKLKALEKTAPPAIFGPSSPNGWRKTPCGSRRSPRSSSKSKCG